MKNFYFWTNAFCVNEENIWFIHGKASILFKYNIRLKKTQAIGVLPEKNMWNEGLYKKILFKDDKIYIIPCHAKKIIKYDIKNNEFSQIYIKEHDGMMFVNAFLVNEKIICIPYSYPGVVSIDTRFDTAKIEYDMSTIMNENSIQYFNSADCLNGVIAMVSPQSDKGYLYYVENNKLEIINVNNEGVRYNSVAMLQEKYIFCSKERKCIHVYDIKSGKILLLSWPLNEEGGCVWSLNNDEFMIDSATNAVNWIYDKNMKSYKWETSFINDRSMYYTYKIGAFDKKSGLYFNNCNMKFYEIKSNERPMEKCSIKITKDICKETYELLKESEYYKNEIIYMENAFSNLPLFLRSITE